MTRATLHALAALCALAVVSASARAQERSMDVTQAPDKVFAEPVATLLPELAGAIATGENGRVGAELVFWGYTLGDGRRAFLFACAQRADVNCEERVPRICVDRTHVLRTSSAVGTIVRRECRTVAFGQSSATRPGCIDRTETAQLSIGLVSCG